jgi:uncharacterized lipoprotein
LSKFNLHQEVESQVRAILPPGELSEILTNAQDGLKMMERVSTHLKSSEAIIPADPEGSVQLSYDVARKSIAALLEAFGLRVHERAGSHSSFEKVTKIAALTDPAWSDFGWMRKMRNRAEYGESLQPPITQAQARESFLAASAMASDARALLEKLRLELEDSTSQIAQAKP